MKKYILPLLTAAVVVTTLLVLFLPAAANTPAKETTYYTAWNATYCRIDGTGDSFEIMRSHCINTDAASAGQLPAFRMDTAQQLSAFADVLQENETVSLHMKDGGRSFAEMLPTYDAAFFKDNSLLLVYMCENSGSNRHQVNSVTIEEDAVTVVIGTLLPKAGDCDMAGWLILLPFTKTQLPETARIIARRAETDTVAHVHAPAATPQLADEPYIDGYCGNTQTTVKPVDGEAISFEFGPSVTITAMLNDLRYDQPLCDCGAEYIVDTEFGLGYEVNITQAFVRYKGKQVALTAAQTDELRTAIEEGLK